MYSQGKVKEDENHKYVVLDEDVAILSFISSGGIAKVFKGILLKDDIEIAIKILVNRKDGKEKNFDIQLFLNESSLMGKIENQYVLKNYLYSPCKVSKELGTLLNINVLENSSIFYMALEYAINGDLMNYIIKKPFDERTARYYFKQLIDGLSAIHEKKIVHRDIKPHNLLLDEEFNLKIADFGFSSYISPDKQDVFLGGTVKYLSPEIINLNSSGNCAFSNDIFSCGVTLFKMIQRTDPFGKADPKDQYYQHIFNNNHPKFWEMMDQTKNFIPISNSLKDFISRMLQIQNFRITLKEIKEHEWFKGSTPDHAEIYEEMNLRKVKIDSEKSRMNNEVIDIEDCLFVKSNDGKYRYVNEQENSDIDLDEIPVHYWKEDQKINYIIRFSQPISSVFFYLISIIKKLEGKIERHEKSWAFNASVRFPSNDMIRIFDHTRDYNLQFEVNLYHSKEKEKKNTVAELVKDRDTDHFHFDEFYQYLRGLMC